MAVEKSIVVTGFGPWAKTAVNPAAQAIEAISVERWAGYRFVPLVVPVVTESLYSLIEEALLTHRPAIWIGFGVAPGSPVVTSGAAAYFSSFPVKDIVAKLKAAGIPAEVSYSAGTHLCNQMLYTTLHLIERHGLATRCGFVHLPYTPEFVAELESPDDIQPSMSLSLMVTAARIAVDCTVKQVEAAGPTVVEEEAG
jgi:pyroglutamyl-peptidase